LCLDEKYASNGFPAENLLGNLLFLAKSMRVKIPPLFSSSTPSEFGMIKSFCSKNPQPKEANIRRLSKTFNEKSDGRETFLKLPT